MALKKDIAELLREDIISNEVAQKITDYYFKKKGQSGNRILIAFGILGALLVGLGIILITAHNWSELDKSTKLIIAFSPLVLSQLLCAYTIIFKPNAVALREVASTLLFFAVGTSMGLSKSNL